MKYLLLTLVVLLGTMAAIPSHAAPPKPKVAWELPSNTRGKGSLILTVDGKNYPIKTKATSPYEELKRSEFKDYRIPPKALVAAYSWHAGFGDVVYVLQKGDELEVYQQEMDESETSHYLLKKFQVIPLNLK